MRTSAQKVREVKGTMALEGLKLKTNEIKMLHRCATGQISSEQLIKDLIKKHTQK
ncbi:hypothetical protein DES36_11477 [Alkalibaculum bacchi]|jgi:hypothetical protein|uniref:Antitoxin VbhA domain-containing protein n=1 Tax=Alkalibaculum bacchi TaxID=645887 RepID=A0A366I450_9FIRM|nr:hypothetical protein [Alkalibaculum bacchi]RBP61393.1 hypothetical protein DES36_11477 [Alkalibaculum bacchi]